MRASWLLAPFAFAPSIAFAQIIPVQLPPLGPGINASTQLNFASGNEYYVLSGTTTVDLTAGSGHGMIFDTIGSTVDTELAVYGNQGAALLSFNDDGGTPPGGAQSVGLNSVLTFGDQTAFTAPYDGTTNGAGCTNSHDLRAGSYLFVVSTFSTVWGCPGATATTRSGGTGAATVHGAIF
ncbi:MAG: hypothetical protein H6738_08520 [Alphaproteobacteria bacterium]|nr:hypothetical protein [Alphaproteobacteria bacterium]MCB9696804.1 hypothetical protein [Alphaproteobacteria bacterium]